LVVLVKNERGLEAVDAPVAVVLNRILFLEGGRVGIDLPLLPLVQGHKLIGGKCKVSGILPLILIALALVLLEVLAERVEGDSVEDVGNDVVEEARPGLSDKCPDFSARKDNDFLLELFVKDSSVVGVELIGGEHNHLGHFAHLVINQLILVYLINPPQVPHEQSASVNPHPAVVPQQQQAIHVHHLLDAQIVLLECCSYLPQTCLALLC
jgi:hypothetical protein